MNEMWGRMISSAALRYAIMAVLSIAILLIIYFKFIYRPSNTETPPPPPVVGTPPSLNITNI